MNAVEIFAGAGGLTLGVAQAGFRHLAVVELDEFACETIRENQRRGNRYATDLPLHHIDIHDFDYSTISEEVDLLCAGLPCQPFSFAGSSRAYGDPRDMFSEVIRAARELRPKAILIENVKGLVRSAFKDYLEYLLLAISSPDLVRDADADWRTHFDTLVRRDSSSNDLKYEVHLHSVNAADYGVPQRRDRVLIVAFRSDLHIDWSQPESTHSLDSLLWEQIKTRQYWKRHGLERKRPGRMSRRFALRAIKIRQLEKRPDRKKPWQTVRDAISDLPRIRQGQSHADVANHFLNPGARSYAGHDGSLIDEASKALKAGTHGVPGGENSVCVGGRRIRYFSVRECARIQTFPDDWVFIGAWSRTMRQVGNAVPVQLARVFAEHIKTALHLVHVEHSTGRLVQFPSSDKRQRAS